MLGRIVVMLLFLSALSASCLLAADESDSEAYPDVILLRNGSAIQGRIIRQVPGQVITIETIDRFERQLSWDRVAMITTIDRLRADRERLRDSDSLYELVERPVMPVNALMLGIFVGDTVAAFSFNLMNGVTIQRRLQLGIAVGWDVVKHHTFTPITLDLRYHWPVRESQVYFHVSTGYAFGWYRKYKEPEFNEEVDDYSRGASAGGPALFVGFGLLRPHEKLMSPRLEAVYRYQRTLIPKRGELRYHLFGVMFGINLW